MFKMLRGYIVVATVLATIGGLVLWWGATIRGNNSHSQQYWQAESARELAKPYTPTCNGRAMTPDDLCIGGGGSYETMVEDHRRYYSPEKMKNRSGENIALGFGWVVTVVGGLVVFVAAVTVYMGAGLFGTRLKTRRVRRAVAAGNGWHLESRGGIGELSGIVDGIVFRVTDRSTPAEYDPPGRGVGDRTDITVELPEAVPKFLARKGVIVPAKSGPEAIEVLTRKIPEAEDVEAARVETLHCGGDTLIASSGSLDDVTLRVASLVRFAHALMAASKPDAPVQRKSAFRVKEAHRR